MGKKFSDLTPEDIVYIKDVHSDDSSTWDDRMGDLMSKFNKSERTVRRWIKKLGLTKYTPKESEQFSAAKNKKLDKDKKYYIITWAQNATPVNKPFLRNIEAYAKFLDADIHVIAGRYKNPTSIWTEEDKDEEWWDELIVKYLDAGRHNVHKYCSILSDVKVVPTAKYPLTGFEGFSDDCSVVVGAPKIHLQSLPVLEGVPSKFMMSTGAITKKNYTDSKAGKLGEFYHMYGFVIIETKDDNTFYFRQVNANSNGTFYDLIYKVENEEVSEIDYTKTMVLGDVHVSDIDRDIDKETKRLLSHLSPNNVIIHDIFNGESISHHDRRDPVLMYHKHKQGRDVVHDEIEDMLEWLDTYKEYSPIVVSSNHNDWIDRWIREWDWRKDIKNAQEYADFLSLALKGEANKGIIAYLIEKRFGNSIRCLDRDESFRVGGYELSYHGDQGQHGSKGNLRQFSRLSTKVIVGDYHQPGRINGAIGVGTMTKLRLKYNKGASAWANAHAIIHPNDRVQHIIFMKDKKATTLI